MNHTPISEAYLGDCMDLMRQFPDGFFELAVVDPPYGIGAGKNVGRSNRLRFKNSQKDWDSATPNKEYFKELFRVSKNQIIWGGNYFISHLRSSRCFLVWDKENAGRDFADCEMAWTSFDAVARIFKHRVSIDASTRIHPTQKPVALYRWLLENYAKPGDKIIDTHMGSQSSRIAAYKMGFDFWGAELDADYFRDGCARFQKEIAEPLFQVENTDIKQTSIFDYQNREL